MESSLQTLIESGQEDNEELRNRVYIDTMGPETHNKVRGYGHGVTPDMVSYASSSSSTSNSSKRSSKSSMAVLMTQNNELRMREENTNKWMADLELRYSFGTRECKLPLYDVSAVYENNEFIIFATIGLPNNVSVVHHVWQQGPMFGNTPGMHSLSGPNVQSFGTLDFLSGKTETSKGSTSTCPLKYAHGIINTISWGILMPIGIIVARYLKTVEGADPAWFHAHRGCQMLAFLGGIAGWGTGIFLGSKSPGIQYKGHRCIGITLFVLATIQVAVALCLRPKKTDENRKYWNWFHWVVGYGTIVLSITNIFKGFDILEPANKWKFAYIAIIGTLGCIAAILELRKLGSFLSRFRSSRAAGPEIVESTQTIV
ncbi:cytochrome b561 and DOMON domain-containing protein At5g47530-like [Pyrus x bretschneideri]|uniref:cytochrome b561 and DOMON domain-containing protein At5g47530-like n=1 Tax=Pyrus x bretschneideri TaxID=225117 RepID=UPI00202EE212|nr:cytochrome b561 and DOMON domain-containing protein At5g47530-like [Pyrus x bretschneideri]